MNKIHSDKWVWIEGFEEYYQVSNLGKVRSVTRVITHTSGGRAIRKGCLLSPGSGTDGHQFVVLCKYGKKSRLLVHRLVYQAFVGPLIDGLVIDHIDCDPNNNHVDNLRQVTHRRNLNNRRRVGTSKYPGVSYDKFRNKWQAWIRIKGKPTFLGRFNREIDAAEAYQSKMHEYI